MGVKGLQYYFESFCSEAFNQVSIQRLAEEHKKNTGLQDSVLVVDGMCILNFIYSPLEWIYGGQWLQFHDKLKTFISHFTNIGVKLIFFYDGVIDESKRAEWVKRRLRKGSEKTKIFDFIKSEKKLPSFTPKQGYLPASISSVAKLCLKDLGCDVITTNIDCDQFIASYAKMHNEVFGILSQDSDFIIYDSKMYLSFDHIDFQTMTTRYYNRERFAISLNLVLQQLPLFACLSGNDYVSIFSLRNFHQTLARIPYPRLRDVAQNIATLVQEKGWVGNYNDNSELEEISYEVFGNTNFCLDLKQGLLSYDLPETINSSVSPRTNLITRQPIHENFNISCCGNAIKKLLTHHVYDASDCFEDPEKKPTSIVFRDIRQRCYCVIFGNAHVQVNEWIAHYGNGLQKPEKIRPSIMHAPLYPQYPPFNIETVWNHYSQQQKMILFHGILQPPMSLDVFMEVPEDIFVLVCILNYLIGKSKSSSHLEPLHVAALIAQSLCQSNVQERNNMKVEFIDPDAVHTTTLFMKGYCTICLISKTCGKPLPRSCLQPWKFFDGKCFHVALFKAKQSRSISHMCNKSQEICQEFYKCLRLATSGTCFSVEQLQWGSLFRDFDCNIFQNK